MKREAELDKDRRKSIKLIDFTTPDKLEDITQENEQVPASQPTADMLLMSDHDPYINKELQLHLKDTERKLNDLATLYEEQQLLLMTYRQKEQNTNELVSNMKKDMLVLEKKLDLVERTSNEASQAHDKKLQELTERHNAHLKALEQQNTLLEKDNQRLQKIAELSDIQLKEATIICKELMHYFQKETQNDDLLT